MPRRSADDAGLVELALGELTGAAVVLDVDRRIVAATPAAVALIGGALVRGEPAAAVLAGVRQRPTPIGADDSGVPRGWLVTLAGDADDTTTGAVQFHGMWTRTPAMVQLFRVIGKVAREDVPILVRGETGAGKELVAQAVHALSLRATGPFRAINCAALPPALLESELFGHAKGAFTGAVKDTPGHFQAAAGGTLFLDEVGELPLEVQAKLLRVLETRSVLPVGGREPVPIDVRIVSATHRALRQEVEAGRFRADLMYRLRVIPVFLPTLRERRGDIALLVGKIIDESNLRGRRQIERVAPPALAALEAYDWPGNVRELRNALAYAFAIGDGPVLTVSDLPPEIGSPHPPARTPTVATGADAGAAADTGVAAAAAAGAAAAADAAVAAGPAVVAGAAVAAAPPQLDEATTIRTLLDRHGGNRAQVASLLGMSRVTLWRRMKRYGLAPSD